MASNTDAFNIAFNQVTFTVENAFYDAVKVRMDALRVNVGDQVKELFEDISLAFGSDAVPAEISGYTDWSDLSFEWVRRKRSRRNRFYVGRTGSMKRTLGKKAGKFLYGEPEVTLGTGLGRGFSGSSGRVRIARGFAGAGRFASAAGALRAIVTITPFPNLPDDPTSIFGGKIGVKVGAGEYGSDNRPSRPFLSPFIRYYTEVKVPQIIDRTIQR